MRVPPTLPDGIYTGVLQIAGVQSNSITVALARNAHFANWSAANLLPGYGAPESLMTAQYCGGLANSTMDSDHRNPPVELGGTTVLVRDSAGVERPAPLLSVSPSRLTYMIPSGTAPGAATITLATSSGLVLTQSQDIQAVAPSIFQYPYPQSGPVAQLVRVRDGQQTTEPVLSQVDMGPASDQIYLIFVWDRRATSYFRRERACSVRDPRR